MQYLFLLRHLGDRPKLITQPTVFNLETVRSAIPILPFQPSWVRRYLGATQSAPARKYRVLWILER
jgi:hypothetical protein